MGIYGYRSVVQYIYSYRVGHYNGRVKFESNNTSLFMKNNSKLRRPVNTIHFFLKIILNLLYQIIYQ